MLQTPRSLDTIVERLECHQVAWIRGGCVEITSCMDITSHFESTSMVRTVHKTYRIRGRDIINNDSLLTYEITGHEAIQRIFPVYDKILVVRTIANYSHVVCHTLTCTKEAERAHPVTGERTGEIVVRLREHASASQPTGFLSTSQQSSTTPAPSPGVVWSRQRVVNDLGMYLEMIRMYLSEAERTGRRLCEFFYVLAGPQADQSR